MPMIHSLLIAVLLSLSMVVSAVDTQITIAGSTTVFPAVDAAQRAYAAAHPGVSFVVGQGGSGTGIEKAGKGDVNIGMASRDLKAEEKTLYPELVGTVIGTDGLALIVNAENPVAGLTKAQVVDLYCGKITDWKELGGAGAVILVTEQEKGGTMEAFKHHFALEAQSEGEGADRAIVFKAKGAAAWNTVRAKRAPGNKEILAMVLADPGAIAFVSVAAAERLIKKGGNVKMLAIDGVEASSAQILAGTYKLTRPLLLLAKPTAPTAANDFVAFMLSAEGQALVSAADFLPVK